MVYRILDLDFGNSTPDFGFIRSDMIPDVYLSPYLMISIFVVLLQILC